MRLFCDRSSTTKRRRRISAFAISARGTFRECVSISGCWRSSSGPSQSTLRAGRPDCGTSRGIQQAELDAFRDALRLELGMPVVRRYSGGQDIHGGCGMLAGKAIGP